MGRKGDKIKTRGGVHFPVNSKRWVDSKEGGLAVQLWVVPKREKNKPTWAHAFGADRVTVFNNEVFIGTDKEDNQDKIDEEGIQRWPLEQKLFPLDRWPPQFNNRVLNEFSHLSIPLLACVTVGSTNWSGREGDEGGPCWRCLKEDLTMVGKNIYNALEVLYAKDAEILIVTWLDT